MANYLKESIPAVCPDQTAIWAASAVQYTNKMLTWAKPSPPVAFHQVIGVNPSEITDIWCEAYALEPSLGGETRAVYLDGWLVQKAVAVVIENCEDAWDEQVVAGVTSGVDAVNKKVGTNSADLDVAVGASAGILASEAVSSVNLSRNTHIAAWVLPSVSIAAGGLQLLLDDTANCASPLETLNLPALSAATWARVYLPLLDPSLLTAVISVGIKMPTDLGAFVLNIDDVQALKLINKEYALFGGFNGTQLQLRLRNETVLGANDSFTSHWRIRECI